jgi:hypothetical protein
MNFFSRKRAVPQTNESTGFVIEVDLSLQKGTLSRTTKMDALYPVSSIYTTKNIWGTSELNDCFTGQTRSLKNQYVNMAYEAFNAHYGFVLNPSQLFLLIMHQIAMHVNQNAEELRPQFVTFSGKKTLTVEVPGSPTNQQWAEIVGTFRDKIAAETVPDTQLLFTVQDFSCSTTAEKIAGDITLMDVCQEFFDYKMMTMCGIPYFVLEGSVEDWQLLREKAEQVISRKTLPSFANNWLPILLPLLDKLLNARKGEEVDLKFWNDFFKLDARHGSGGYTFVNGWINCFFPVTKEKSWNRFCVPYDTIEIDRQAGCDIADFTSGMSSAPVEWTRLSEVIPMRFFAGFVGGKVVHSDCIRPEVGWCIAEVDEKKPPRRF